MRNFRSYIKENMLDSDREVNYYNSLANEKKKLLTPKEPTYQKAFLGKINSIGNLNEVRLVRQFEVSDKIHNPKDYDELDNDEAPNVEDVDNTHQFLMDLVKNIPHDKQQLAAIHDYTDTAYQDINQHLYGTKSELTNPKNQEHIDNLKELISKSTTPEDLTVFTGIKKNPAEYSAENKMIHMINPAFTSTSLAHGKAREFAKNFPHRDENDSDIMNDKDQFVSTKHIVRLNIPKNSHGYYADYHSSAGDEREWILHPGAKFKLWHKPSKFVDRNNNTLIYNHWYGRMVHDGIKEHPILEDDPYHPKNLGI